MIGRIGKSEKEMSAGFAAKGRWDNDLGVWQGRGTPLASSRRLAQETRRSKHLPRLERGTLTLQRS
jgi:hypothetical protein